MKAVVFVLLASCAKPQSTDPFANSTTPASTSSSSTKYLYVASGACYAGGATTATPTNTVVRFNLASGTFDSLVADYTLSSPDSPSSITPYDSDNILVSIENGSTSRRIERVNKRGTGRTTLVTNTTAMSGVLRGMAYLSDGGILVAKTSAVEKFGASGARITVGGNPYINAPAGNCATSTTLMSHITELANGKLLFTHAGATPNNKIGIISATGYAAAGDCLITASTAGPTTTALPVRAIIHSSGKLIVAYGSSTTASNLIYAYDINISTNAVSGATSAYSNNSILQGPSAMVEDQDGYVYVAMGQNTFNTIEKFSFSATTKTLTRVGTTPFINANVYTKCISGMVVSD